MLIPVLLLSPLTIVLVLRKMIQEQTVRLRVTAKGEKVSRKNKVLDKNLFRKYELVILIIITI